MEFAIAPSLSRRPAADALVVPFWKGKKKPEAAADITEFKSAYEAPLEVQDFVGKEGETLILYAQKKTDPRLILLGLGEQEKVTVEKLRRAYASLVKACRPKKIKEINVLMPHIPSLAEEGIVRGISEGILLANYAFDKLKKESIKEEPTVLLKKATLIGTGKPGLMIAEKHAAIMQAVYLTRDLINSNADDVTPQFLSEYAKELAKELPHVKTTVFDKRRIEKEGMELLLAVNRGSHRDPAFIIMEYKGAPKSKDLTVLVGKGVTYDTGGLNIKPTGSMETMKADMSGAAVVMGILYGAAKIKLPINLTAVIVSTENAIGPNSYKPGDVYKSHGGKTVEIGNTDAEGRLILADALSYVTKTIKPSRVIDFATLTGAMEIALGNEAIGFWSNQDSLADALVRAGHDSYERLWRMPLFEEYREQLKSDVADIRNIGGRGAGSITAAYFLKEFVGDTPWAHCDIAATAFLNDAKRYHPKHGTGIGVRLMLDFLQNM